MLLKRIWAVLGGLLMAMVITPSAQAAGIASLAPVAPVVSCASLASADLSSALGAKAEWQASEVNGEKAYCQITGTIAPAIKVEIRLPLKGWTQRYLQTGCGGLCGNLRIDAGKAEGCAPVTDGSVILASTDMGHQGNDMGWGDDQHKREDFAYRSLHLTAVAAKAFAKAFYGQAPRYSYFAGCSDGGREALIMAQRYPLDFDGITAGAPALNFSVQNSFHHAWLAKVNTAPDGKPILTAADIPVLAKGVMDACDKLDGLKDGQITDPRACHYNPAMLECVGPYEAGKCLTATQIATARAIYQGARTADGKALEVGPLLPGSEKNWIGVFVPFGPNAPIFSGKIALDAINHVLFTPNPATPYTVQNFPFTEAMFRQLEPASALYNADNADLSAFYAHGGRLILWHGWADPHISPLNTIDYFERVGAKMGKDKRDAFVRLFLMPGMGHCSGGDGPSEFPLLANIMGWVEGGEAPNAMVAKRATQTRDGQPMGMGPNGPDGQRRGPPPEGMMPPRDGMAPPEGMRPPEGMPPRDGQFAMGPRPEGAPSGPPAGMMPPPQAKLSPRSRPVFAYPQVAKYNGSGSVDQAENFSAFMPEPVNGLAVWVGAK